MPSSTSVMFGGGVEFPHRRLPTRSKMAQRPQGRALTNSDIEHYQKIIVALVETDRIMKEIDKNMIEKFFKELENRRSTVEKFDFDIQTKNRDYFRNLWLYI